MKKTTIFGLISITLLTISTFASNLIAGHSAIRTIKQFRYGEQIPGVSEKNSPCYISIEDVYSSDLQVKIMDRNHRILASVYLDPKAPVESLDPKSIYYKVVNPMTPSPSFLKIESESGSASFRLTLTNPGHHPVVCTCLE